MGMFGRKIFMNKVLKYVTITFGSLVIILFFRPILHPFPQPTGKYGVGVEHASFINESLPVDLFYPTAQKTTKLASYEPQKVTALCSILAQQKHVPKFFFEFLFTGVTSYTQPLSPIADDTFPVVLFFPGIASIPFYNIYIEEIVSHGYIVGMIYPPGDTQITIFPDGKVQELNPNFQQIITNNDREKIYQYRTQAFAKWFKDGQMVLDEINQLNQNQDSRLYQKFNLEEIAVIGHSHGGSVAIELVKQDPRVKTGIDMDGWTYTVNTTEPLTKPFLVMTAIHDFTKPLTGGSAGFDIFMKNMQNQQKDALAIIPKADHDSFSDMIQLKWPLGMHQQVAQKTSTQIKQHLLQFLAKHLRT